MARGGDAVERRDSITGPLRLRHRARGIDEEQMGPSRARVQILLASAVALQLAATPSFAQTEVNDPFERVNRRFYAVNQAVDRAIFLPLARAFGKAPGPVRRVIRNVTRNLGEPLVFVNDVLQGHVGTAPATLGRFVINSTIGVAGIFDVAGRTGIPHHDNGFGTTLGRWGAKPGPYVFLPVFGPSNVRDTFGTVGDLLLNPLDWARYSGDVAVGVTTGVLGGLNERYEAQPQLEAIRTTSTDPYATLRSYYSQNREADIHGQTEPGALPDIDVPLEEPPPDTSAAPGAAPEAAPAPEAAEPADGEPAATPPESEPSAAPAAPATTPPAASPEPEPEPEPLPPAAP
jgi:phospholipid-binding lipoprotein MlaA